MHYDGLFILNLGGKEDGQAETIKAIETAVTGLDGKVTGTQKMDKRRFERVAGELDAGVYVNIVFDLEPTKLADLRTKLSDDDSIYRQFYLRCEGGHVKAPEAEPVAA